MELIILGIFLFIVGVAGTFAYDYVVTEKKRRDEFLTANPRSARKTTSKPGPFTKAAKTMKTIKHDEQSINEEFLRQYAAHVKSQARPATPTKTQTMTVQELMEKLEQMKKDL